MTNTELIAALKQQTEEVLATAEQWRQMPEEQLQWKQSAEKWSALECIEHLNWFSDVYIPEIDKELLKGKKVANPDTHKFKSGWLGNKFANMLKPSDNMMKMKAPGYMQPKASKVNMQSLDKFIADQKKVLEQLESAKNYDMAKTKVRVSFTSLLKIRLGDTFRVIVYHNQRHIQQGMRSLAMHKATG